MLGERSFHFGAEYFVAAAVDHVLPAIENANVALGVDSADIARTPEAIHELARRRRRVIPIALHHHRAADPQLVVHYADLRTGHRQPDAVATPRRFLRRHDGRR